MRPIPLSVKAAIVRKYLEGDSDLKIGEMFNVSVGAISSIVKEESTKDGYFLVLREVAKILKSNNLTISDVISGIRLKNKVKETGLTIPLFEDFLESTDTESFRLGIDHEKFLETVKSILRFEKTFKIKVGDLSNYKTNMMNEIIRLNGETTTARQELSQIYDTYSVKKADIEDYLRKKPIIISRSNLTKKALQTHFDWMVIPPDESLEKASSKIGIKIDRKTFYKNLNSIYKEPDKHIDILKQIMNS